ncbi:PAAR domain-containing protein [Raoultella planticola]|uniref:PAAR domain-containing protein n=1 Tax=Raoultella planticola TaxID=575 RepID=UPI0009071C20
MSDNRWSGVHGKNSGLDGDKTSTGAVCYAGSQGWSVNGRRKLYVGDKTSPCPKCGQPGVIASGDLRPGAGCSRRWFTGTLWVRDRNELRDCGGKSVNGKNYRCTEPVRATTFFS